MSKKEKQDEEEFDKEDEEEFDEEDEEKTEEETEEKPSKPLKKKEKEPADILVVPELPTQPIREIEAEDGKTYTLVTTNEALTEILKNTREIKKALI